MADFEYFETDDTHPSARGGTMQPGGPPIGTLVNWAGAAVSLGLVVGMAVWAYQLTMRDVSGVPVIRALEGPMRVAPADPGGVQAAHQGLAVNRIAEGGEAAPVPDRLVLAPPPVDFDEMAFASTSAPAPSNGPDPDPVPAPTPAAISAGTQALIERLIDRAEPLGPVQAAADTPAPEAAILRADAPLAEVIPASVPGVARSLRPASRPASLSSAASSAAAANPPTDTVRDLDAATLPAGTRLVQLGAFDTPDIARAEWDRLTGLFPDYFADRGRVIEEASAGGSAFYRLRAHGFDDLAASRRFCAALMARNAPCISVTVR